MCGTSMPTTMLWRQWLARCMMHVPEAAEASARFCKSKGSHRVIVGPVVSCLEGVAFVCSKPHHKQCPYFDARLMLDRGDAPTDLELQVWMLSKA